MRSFTGLPLSLLALILPVLAQRELAVTDYAPNVNQTCPDTTSAPLIRVFAPQNQSLHSQEQEFINQRLSTVIPNAWSDWVGDASALGYNTSLLQNAIPKIGMAISGGGYRAAQYGAGVLSAFDARNDSAKAAGTGGFLQVSSYLAGLSGGSWITGSLYLNDFPTMSDMVYGNDKLSGWILDLDLATPAGLDVFDDMNQYFFGSILWSIIAKGNQWIDTSMTDPWARMISYHFLNGTTRGNFFTNDSAHGAGQLWSHIPTVPSFQQYQTPFPIVMADSRPVGSNMTTFLPPEPVVYEITPFEFGSWDPNLSAMMNLTYAGTHLKNGQPDNDTACVTAFDQAGFIMGTSASLFNQILDFGNNKLEQFGQDGAGLLQVLRRQLDELRTRADDVANWPSPFQGIKPDTFEDSSSRWIELIDGSSNGENVPLGPLFVKARGLDVIVAIDSSADDPNGWPNGSSIVFTKNRLSNLLQDSHQQFPPIPNDADAGFISSGIRQRPTFLGCNPAKNPPEFPMVIYMPNSPPLNGDDPVTNTATFKIDYTQLHTRLFLDQAHANSIGGFWPHSNSPDPHFGQCLQCAAIDRARYKHTPPIPRSNFCAICFAQYCFDPQNPPSADALPNRKLVFVDPQPTGLAKLSKFFSDNRFAFLAGAIALVAVIGSLIAFFLWRRKAKAREARYAAINIFVEEDAAPWIKHRVYDPYEEVEEDEKRWSATSTLIGSKPGSPAPSSSYRKPSET